MSEVKEIVRVAVSNNFNCTNEEFEQIELFAKMYKDKTFFVNSNINTPNLKAIADNNFNCVITINPMLLYTSIDSIIEKLNTIKSKISFVRIKYLPENESILKLIHAVNNENIPIVITNQRFNNKKSLELFTNKKYYTWKNSRFRLNEEQFKILENIVSNLDNVYICDKSGKGCMYCGLCSKLNIGKIVEVKSLNLSSSYICKFNCPDCYAKTMQSLLTKWGNQSITYDTIISNSKQNGKLKHIKDNIAKDKKN